MITSMKSTLYVLIFTCFVVEESFPAAINHTSTSGMLQPTLQNISNNSNFSDYYYYDIPPDDGFISPDNNTDYYTYDDFANETTSNLTHNNTSNDYSNVPSDDYLYEEEYFDSYGICTSNVLTASDVVRVLSPEIDASVQILSHWTIAPWYKGGSVTVAKRDNVVTDDIFLGGCGELEIFQSELNGTSSRKEATWCQEKRLLPCDANMQMTYHIFGYSLISEPGKAIDVVYTPMNMDYNYGATTATDKTHFSMYYYECGGHRFGGDIRSPIFPDEPTPYTGSVTCTWILDVEKSADYGILRFSRFHLPDCENHHLIIEEDTIIEEKDVTESLLMMLNHEEVEKNGTLDESKQDSEFPDYDKAFNTSQIQKLTNDSNFTTDENKNAYFYRESTISPEEARKNPRAGIHAVVITKYCGKYQPKRTIYWRRGSENVTLSFVSENHTLRKYGFVARFSAFSWSNTMKEHRGLGMGKFTPPRRAVSGEIFNYIVLIVFVPIGLTIGLAIIIFHIKKRGPTIHDFYRKEKKMLRLQRANTERVKSRSPKVRRPTRRTQSLDYPHSIPEDSGLAESELLVKPNQIRRGSLMNVRFLMAGTRRKLSFQLGNNSRNDKILESKTQRTVRNPEIKKSGSRGVS